ncbi:MAG TPA: hypothetical protein VEV43_10545 [Actinomycetota bacterium]|nr:hypothetical protein [Actinomycetota bacterium]
MQFIRDLREVTGALKELVADDDRHEEDAKLELAVSAQRFSQETREVVDDKLSFSATLMRAGEVDAATRLLAEVEAEVRDNEAALIESVNEVKVARAARRERITRMRLARSLAVAMLGAAVMATSAAGMAFASFLEDRAQAEAAAERRHDRRRGDGPARAAAAAAARADRTRPAAKVKRVELRGVEAALTAKAFAAFEQLKSGDVEPAELEHLLSLLPAELAETMRQALATTKVAEKTVKDALPILSRPAAKKKADKADQAADGAEKQDPPAEEPKDEEPDPEPDPEPTQSPGDEEPDDEDGTMLSGITGGD